MNIKGIGSLILCGVLSMVMMGNIPSMGEVRAADTRRVSSISQIEAYGDVRGMDLSGLDLSDQRNLLYTLDFDTYTKWPSRDKMPVDFEPQKVMEAGKNPGLNIRKLQAQGYTGKGVTVAYVDQPLLVDHNEYKHLDLHYETIKEAGEQGSPSMHGPAVLSLLAGKDIGIVPDATVYFMGHFACGEDQKNEAASFERLIEINKSLPEDKKIKIIGMSHRVADKPGYYLKNSDRLRKAQEEAERQGMMVIDCDTFEDCVLLAITADKDPDDYRNYEIAKKYTTDRPKGKLCVPIARTYAAGYINDPSFYQFTQNGGQSWSVPYIVGVIAMGLQIDSELTKSEAIQYLYESGYDFRGGKIINPEGFLEMVKNKGEAKQSNLVQTQDYCYVLYNKNKVTKEDSVAITEYTQQMQGKQCILKDVSAYRTGVEVYNMLKKDASSRKGTLKGIQIFGTAQDVPAFDADFKVQMQKGVDEGGNFKTDFFYSNFQSEGKALASHFSIYRAFNEKLEVSFVSQWPVARLPLSKGEIAPYMVRYAAYMKQVKKGASPQYVNFSNPIFASKEHSDDFGRFLEEVMNQKLGVLKSKDYKLYGNQQGYYPVNTKVLGDFTKENLKKENQEGIKEFIINTHGQWDNIDQTIFKTADSKSEKRASFLNKKTINEVLSHQYYDLDLWTCLNAEKLDNRNIVHEAMSKGKCISAMAATSIISNNGVSVTNSLDKMKENNFYYFYYNYLKARAEGQNRSTSFQMAQRNYAIEILKHKNMLGEGNYQFNLHNVLSYHYLGLIECDGYTTTLKADQLGKENEQAKTNVTTGQTIVKVGERKINFTTNYLCDAFKVNSLKAYKAGEQLILTINYTSNTAASCSLFNPPEGDSLMKVINAGIEQGTHEITMTLEKEELDMIKDLPTLTMKFWSDDKSSFIWFDVNQLLW